MALSPAKTRSIKIISINIISCSVIVKFIFYLIMNYKNLKQENRENYAIIQIANSKNNSLDTSTLKELTNAIVNLDKEKKIKCIGLVGNSKFFSPGADINELKKFNQKEAKKIKLFDSIKKIEKIKKPVISFIEGYHYGGLELAY